MAVQSPPKKSSSASTLPSPALIPLGHHAGKPPISLAKMVMLVGSRHNAHLHLLSRHVSKAHALILSHGGRVYIRDLASREHVYVNGVRQREAWLRNGDLLKIGSFTFKFKGVAPKASAAADEPAEPSDLEVEGADAPLAIAEKVMLIGRRPTCDVPLTEASASTAHAVIFHVAGQRYIRDLGSRTGTFVNGKKVHQQALNPGDAIRIGETDMRYVPAAEHSHHIEPVGVGDAGEVDELEHLVGTAPLDMAAELGHSQEQPGVAEAADAARGLHAVAAGGGGDDELKPEDLIELDLGPEPTEAPVAPLPPVPVAPPSVEEPIAIESAGVATPDELSFTAPADVVAPAGDAGGASATKPAAAAEPEFVEIDLSADPDVSDVPSAADTRALGMAVEPPPAKPTLSGRVVDEVDEPLDLESVTPEPPAAPVEAGASVPADVDELPLLDEAVAAIEPGAEAYDEVISPRGGWQGMTRVEDDTLAGELDAPLTVVGEPTIEESAMGAPSDVVSAEGLSEEPLAVELLSFDSEALSELEAGQAITEEARGPELKLPVEESAVTPATEQGAEGEPGAELDLKIDEVVTPTPVEPVAEVAEITFDESAIAPMAEPEVSATVTAEAAPLLVVEPAVETPVVEEPTAEAPVGEADTAAAGGAVIPVAEPEERFAKKGRARKSKADRKVAGVTGEKPGKGRRGRKSKKGQEAEVEAGAESTTGGEVAGAAAAAGIVGAAIVAEKVVGEETNVIAAEQGAAADVAGVVEGAAEVEISRPGDEPVPVTADAEGVVPIPDAVAAEEVSLPAVDAAGAAAITDVGVTVDEAAVAPLEESVSATQSTVEADVAGEAMALSAAMAEEPLAGGDDAGLELGAVGEVVEVAPSEDEAPAVLVSTERARRRDEAGGVGAGSPETVPPAGAAIDVVEATEPTPESALDLNLAGDDTWGAELPEAGAAGSLTDSTFGRQVEAFTETSSGELVEDAGEVRDSEEALAIALWAGEERKAAEPQAVEPQAAADAGEVGGFEIGEDAGFTAGGADAELVASADVADLTAESELELDGEHTDVTDGGIEPTALGVTSDEHVAAAPDEHLSAQQFEANGEAVHLDTPGIAEADAVLGGQAFVAEAQVDDAHDVRGSATEELDGQSFVAEAAEHEVKEMAPPPEPVAVATPPQAPPSQPQAPQGGGRPAGGIPVQPPPPQAPPGGFVIGTDLSSFIGGMPLVLPDLPPQPSGFGQVQVSFAGAKAPWQQAQRPAFPMGQGLAQEVMDAAQGLRDVEDMDEDVVTEGEADDAAADEVGEESFTDDGAPGDEWNVAAVLEDEDEPVSAEWAPGEQTGDAAVTQAVDLGLQAATAPQDRHEPQEAPAPEAGAEPDGLVELPPGAVDEEHVGGGHDHDNDDDDSMLQEIDLSGAFSGAGFDEPAPAAAASHDVPESDEELTEEQLLEITGEDGVVEQLAPLPEGNQRSNQSATAGVDEAASGFEVETPGLEFDEITVEELAFDEPAETGTTGPVSERVSDLTFDEAPPEAESVIDRSPPPPIAPPPPPAATSKRAAAAKAAAAPVPVLPPPAPAKAHKPRGGGSAAPAAAGAPRSFTGAPPEDAIFGSLEHGKVAAAPFGGAAGGVREVDVFATPSAAEDAEGGDVEVQGFGAEDADGGGALVKARGGREGGEPGAAAAAASALAAPASRRPQRVIVPPRMDALAPAAAVAAASRGTLARPSYGPPPKKNVAGRITVIVLLMLISMALAVGGIFYFVKVKQTNVGELHFQNVGALTKMQRKELAREQFDYLMSPKVRLSARSYVTAMGLPAGFLEAGEGEAERIARVRPEWPDDRPTAMTIEYAGTDPSDRKRVYALLMAMYQENSNKVNESLRLKSEIGKLEKKLKEYEDLRAKRDALKRVVDAAPTPETMQQLDAAVREADAAYDAATQAVKEAQLDARRLEEQLPGGVSPGEAGLKQAGGDAKATPADAELAELQKQLEAAATKAADLKGVASAEADAKQKMLDQAVNSFEKTASEMMRQNPQLAQYVQAVQQLQEKTHKLGQDLIGVQQQQHTRLSALKKDMDEQVLARRTEIWAADKGLADLRAQLDLANRKFNAARDQGFTEESREVRDALAEIKDLTQKTESRKQTLGNDPIVTKVADALQELINITKERLDADRARIEKDIKDQEQAFAQSGMIERLPEQQKAQAKVLEEKQRAISELRKQYADALDRRTAESNEALRELDAQVTSIRGRIDERKRVLAQEGAKNLTQQQEAERRAALQQRQVALKKAEEQLTAAQRVFVERTKALRSANQARDEGVAARQEYEAIEQTLATKDEEAKYDKLALDERNDRLKKIVKVEEPKESDVRAVQGRDDRWMYSMGAVIGLAVVFIGFAVASVAGGGDRRSHLREPGEEYEDDDEYGGGVDGGPMAIHEIGARDDDDDDEKELSKAQL